MRAPVVVVASVAVALLALPAGAAPPPQQQIARLKELVAALKTQVKQLRKRRTDLNSTLESAWRHELAPPLRGCTKRVWRDPAERQPAPRWQHRGALIHGNGSLWVAMPPSNVVVTESSSGGTIQTKYPWWRSVAGTLRIEGRRLDGPAAGLRATDVPDGYGATGFQASAVTFPTEGCWEVTGRVGTASLTLVTLVLKAG